MRRRALGAAGAALLCGALGGCSPPLLIASVGLRALQSGAAVYTNRRLEAVAVISMEEIYHATVEVLGDLGFTLITARLREDSAYIEAKEANGRKVKISLDRRTPVVTKAKLRVGLLGDQPMSRLIFARVIEKLGIGPVVDPEGPFYPELLPQPGRPNGAEGH